MKCAVHIVISFLIFSSCGSRYEGFKEIGDDVHIQLHILGEGTTHPTNEDSIKLRIRAARLGEEPGSYVSTERWYAVKDLRVKAMSKILNRTQQGDSLSVIMKGLELPWSVIIEQPVELISDTTHIRMELSVLDLRTPAMIKAALDRHKRNDPEGYEKKLIAAYRELHPKGWQEWGTSGIYYIITGEAIDTNKVVVGTGVTISYTGVQLEDGKNFDDTERNGEPLSFVYGDRDQVMNGLEVAITLLRKGQQGVFLFPSQYAFGAKGIPGVLEPYMPVMYTVKLLRTDRTPS